VALAVLTSLWSRPAAESLALEVRPVPLNSSDPSQVVTGPLVFRGGLWLRSEDADFGGLSGLHVSPDGSRVVAVSDCGKAFSARLVYDARGHLSWLEDAALTPLLGPRGRALERPEGDAEGLAPDADGGLLVSFEGEPPRLARYAGNPPLGGRPEARSGPVFDEDCTGNKGPEALARAPDGRVLLVCEGAGLRPSWTTVWLGRDGNWVSRPYPLASNEPGLHDVYRPTGAAFLPGGDLLVLERRFPPLAARLVRVRSADLDGVGPLHPREVVRLDPPLTLDNFEGLAVRRDDAGATLIYLVSDDNGCSKGGGVVPGRVQRTLLMLFELRD